MKKLLILGGSEFQIPLLQAARRRGLYICLADRNERAPAIPWADEYHCCSLKDTEGLLALARAFGPDGVTVGMCDVAVPAAAAICEALGLPGLDRETAARATDKRLMIEAFRAGGVAHPRFWYLEREELTKLPPELCRPVISKPTDMAGSRGVRLSRTPAELAGAVAESSRAGDSGNVLLEEYLTGPEVSVELLVKGRVPHVLQVTDKLTSGAPHFTELGHVQPSALPEEALGKIRQLACAAARALGLADCLAHGEIILTDEGPKLVEMGARMGGDGIQEQLILLSAGMDLPALAVQLALGEEVHVPRNCLHRAAAIGFLPSRPGRVLAIEGLDEAANMEHVLRVRPLCRAGDDCGEPVDNSGRWAYVLTQADTPREAAGACRKALARLRVHTAPPAEQGAEGEQHGLD